MLDIPDDSILDASVNAVMKTDRTITIDVYDVTYQDPLGRWGGPARGLLPNTSVPFS